jgi:hypothetical protein
MTDPTKFRPIADYHIVRFIHKFNPEDQTILQVNFDTLNINYEAKKRRLINDALYTRV